MGEKNYDYLDFEPYTIDALREEMRRDMEAVDKIVEEAEKYVAECIRQETAKEKALSERIRQTTIRNRNRR